MHPFLQSLVGGAMIGAAASGLLLVNGRIAGVSSILAGAASLRPERWQWAFVGGLAAAGLIAVLIGLPAPAMLQARGVLALAFAGLLVGIGTRLGAGCTSGHGVCGLANLSPRSLAATLTFMAVAGVVVFVARHTEPARGLLTGWGFQ